MDCFYIFSIEMTESPVRSRLAQEVEWVLHLLEGLIPHTLQSACMHEDTEPQTAPDGFSIGVRMCVYVALYRTSVD